MAVPACVSLVTLGVADVAASTRFYQALGFELSSASVGGEVSFFRTAGGVLAVWGADELAADAQVPAESRTGSRGVSLAVNVASAAAVDEALAHAQTSGATVTRPARTVEWGGYNGYFTDPDGHLWEVAYNPYWPLDAQGLPVLP
jgi:predicted lactoylglutathione lyase